MTRRTQMMLALRSDIIIETIENTSGLHAMWLTYGEYHSPLITSDFVLKTRQEAHDLGVKLIKEAKEAWGRAEYAEVV